MGNKADITGAVGAVPPPDAPIEQAQPLKPETIEHQLAKAAQNERTLKQFKHHNKPGRSPVPVAPPAAQTPVASAIVAASRTDALIADVFGDPEPVPTLPLPTPSAVPANDPGLAEVEQMADLEPELPPLTAEELQRMPAASNTDTPGKGLLPTLTPKLDKFDGISPGGFGDIGEAQYFPLDGNELRELVEALMDDVHRRIQNDLRFSMALTYPRVRATVQVVIEGHSEDNNAGFTIEKFAAPKEGTPGGTPAEIAARVADRVCFVVLARRQEFSQDGVSDQPPDAIRDELGLNRPRKQLIAEGPQGQRFADIVHPAMANSAALTQR